MPKSYNHLFPKIATFGNLHSAWEAASRGKRRRLDVAAFERNLEPNLLRLERELRDGSYQPGGYRSFYIREPKRRRISAAPFRDRVVHHALVQVIAPIWEARFSNASYACRIGKGTHRAANHAQALLKRYRYMLKADVAQFFPSIDHAVLEALLARHIACRDTLDLCRTIIASGDGILASEYTLQLFPSDDLFAALRPRGLPIGNLTSQFWANVMLHPLDLFIKQELHCRAYLRYCDDLLLFADDKATLHEWRAAVQERLATLRLTLHENRAQVVPVETGLPFLGWRIYPERRRLKRRNVIAFTRRFRQQRASYAAGHCTLDDLTASVQGWVGHARHGTTAALRRSLLSAPLPRRGAP
jgi:hypothetical protein